MQINHESIFSSDGLKMFKNNETIQWDRIQKNKHFQNTPRHCKLLTPSLEYTLVMHVESLKKKRSVTLTQ